MFLYRYGINAWAETRAVFYVFNPPWWILLFLGALDNSPDKAFNGFSGIWFDGGKLYVCFVLSPNFRTFQYFCIDVAPSHYEGKLYFRENIYGFFNNCKYFVVTNIKYGSFVLFRQDVFSG